MAKQRARVDVQMGELALPQNLENEDMCKPYIIFSGGAFY